MGTKVGFLDTSESDYDTIQHLGGGFINSVQAGWLK